MKYWRWALGIALAVSFPINAADGFDDDFSEVVISKANAKNLLYGSLDFEAHYNINNDKNLSSLKVLADVIGEYKLNNGNKVKGNLKVYHDFVYGANLSNYTTTPKGYKHELNLNELTLEGSINPKIGRQIVVWRRSDSIRITDVLNPLDNRMPGLVGIKNLRLGRLMSKLDYYFDKLNLSMIVLHENRFSKTAAYGSDFKISADKPVNKPSNALDNTGVALSLTGVFEGYDLGLYFADTYTDKPYLEGGVLQFDNRSKMLGMAYNQAIDSYLLKAENAHFDHIKYNGMSVTPRQEPTCC